MNVKIDKKLGTGYNGCLSTKSIFARQILFDDFAKLHKDHFITLVFSGIKEDCKHKQQYIKDQHLTRKTH